MKKIAFVTVICLAVVAAAVFFLVRPSDREPTTSYIVATGTIAWNSGVSSWEFADDAGSDAAHRYRLRESPDKEACTMDTFRAKMKLKVSAKANGVREAEVLEVLSLEKHACDM